MKIQSPRKYKALSTPIKAEEPKAPILPEVEVEEEEVIDNPDDGEGEG